MSSTTNTSPAPFGIDVNLIPPALRNAPIWLNWRSVQREAGKKSSKVPVQPNGTPASTTNPATWCTLDAALAPSAKMDGIGFVLGGAAGPDGSVIAGIDLDHLADRGEGETDDAALARRVERANRMLPLAGGAYREMSPSGAGIHIVGYSRVQPQVHKRDDVEIYTRGRYFTLTTNHAWGDLADITGLIEALVAEVPPRSELQFIPGWSIPP
jgi:primase-polymerase (primpol)-like protein